MKTNSSTIKHILSFDVEEYFDVELAARAGIDAHTHYPRRVRLAMDFILNTLAERNANATFFVLGRLAEKENQLIKEIAGAGHELACHSMNHIMITKMTPQSFRNDLLKAKKSLEDIIGKPIIGYRAPTFSIVKNTTWALDEIINVGFKYDSSIYPVRHNLYGLPEAPTAIHYAITPAGNSILELPVMTRRIFTLNVPVGGGGYFRLLPLSIITSSIKKYQQHNHHAVLYFHPWEFDPEQPVLPMPTLSRLRHRIGLRKTRKKLNALLKQFEFTSVSAIIDTLKNTDITCDYETFKKSVNINSKNG